MSEQNLGFHHKLESLLRDCAVTNSEGYSEALEALRDMAPDLARRVIAAEKLVNALENMISAYSEPDRQLCCDGQHCGCRGGTVRDEADWISCSALTAYREVSK